MWTTPAATEMRFGFEVNHVRNEQIISFTNSLKAR